MAWLPKNRVVVPVDFSEPSLAAVRASLELVQDSSHLDVIFVLPALEPAEPGVIWNAIDNTSRKRHAESALQAWLNAPDLQAANLVIQFGDPGRKVAEYAETHKADLIVLPSHGRTGLPRLLLGSVAEKVVRLAHCPVLVLKH
jgi:nucleotide-binding universal stress UspA family protein